MGAEDSVPLLPAQPPGNSFVPNPTCRYKAESNLFHSVMKMRRNICLKQLLSYVEEIVFFSICFPNLN